MGKKWRMFVAKLVIKAIRRYFSGGLSGGIGYVQWRWSDEFERLVCGRNPPASALVELGTTPNKQSKCAAQIAARLTDRIVCNELLSQSLRDYVASEVRQLLTL